MFRQRALIVAATWGGMLLLAPPAPTQDRPLLVDQLGHQDTVRFVRFSPDGKLVLTGGEDRSAILWDAATGKTLQRFAGHADPVNAGFISADGKRVVTDDGKGLRLWDAGTGREIFPSLQANRYGKGALAFSPDGKLFATTDDVYEVRLWDAATGKLLGTCQKSGREYQIRVLRFSPDGKQLLIGGADPVAERAPALRLWSVATGKEALRFQTPTPIGSATFSPDGKRVLAGSDKITREWDAGTGAEIRTFEGGRTVAYSADGKHLLTADGACNRIWDAATGKLVRESSAPAKSRLSGALSPDGKALLERTDTELRLTEIGTGKLVSSFPAGKDMAYRSEVVSPDGTVIVAAQGNAATVIDASTGKVLRRLDGSGVAANAVAFSSDGKLVLTGGEDGTASLWDLSRAARVLVLRGHTRRVTAVAISPDRERLATGSFDDTVRVWDAATGKELTRFKGGGLVFSVAFAPDGKSVLSGGFDTARVWDLATGKEVHAYSTLAKNDFVRQDVVKSAAFSPDGKLLARGGSSSGLTVWDTATKAKLAPYDRKVIPGMRLMAVVSVAFSADSAKLATVDENGQVEVRDPATGKLHGGFNRAYGVVRPGLVGGVAPAEVKTNCVALSPDGKSLLIGCQDGTVELRGAGIQPGGARPFGAHAAAVTGVAFSPDGKFAATAGADTAARIWDVTTGKEVCKLMSFRNDSWAILTADNYYAAARGALPSLAFRFRDRAFTFEQFDLRFHRPDKVLECFKFAQTELAAAYREAFQQRLKRMNYTEAMLGNDFDVPEVELAAFPPPSTRERTIKLRVKARDAKFNLDRVHIDVNGVPLRGANGIDVRKPAARTWEQEVEVELSAGDNRIDVSVLNEKGAESLRQTAPVRCEAAAKKPDLYVVAVGVSDYADARFKLVYADKDARDLSELLAGKRAGFGEVKVLRVLNRDATRENILKAAEFLKPSGVDDAVVVFFAGHGVLDAKRDYFFGTADIDFADPAKRGLPYPAIEGLLAATRARKKLLLVDTCHSGEVNKEDTALPAGAAQPDGAVRAVARGGLTPEAPPRVGLKNSFQLMQDLYADLRRGTGAVVVASAGGAEYALESAEWKNGVFTYAVLRGLKGGADRNKDGKVQVLELRGYVEEEVRRLTGGRQSPTARSDNVLFDFAID
ncbi:(myosin heavy-chain) kinase : WD40 repeat, subgroup OS=Calditerrivibrio nitroreducens (strain DSM 19672 / NBRC 101217 / Yu37-1) GN=Calni_0847 PE=4 SV=1: WD40: WD40: WD40: WD40: WD40: WD40: Peptidase_C14 [Gemmataceae bacterium]|nr:(myosin heavy-chain) kinase : WD40 repeat, subgroup OS=Calditerrivibrio nitroreducens (strain DSM 19672 / NBRC 101217 / Yu37-1) GN=Calni_0847 PE=4 SV=1: WD40: WD40: WD40: WD40: WD40: WD40: Peptidase_C14 [Gemmataceae bacterium]VTT99863.1 (myosin heavy-chain) kinase : WD40 repeat, subgroup OS=Calditerrivibrio nitroreducens (strain DSM 19672 / NBRC 101217 / Yu37-1) GN=Calni_0847 PE=4 SV=1: WD40: WD40: WD40: WD40: WD40: WD40: Peptidase_C14 [Gemmataceae bacterium]